MTTQDRRIYAWKKNALADVLDEGPNVSTTPENNWTKTWGLCIIVVAVLTLIWF